MCGIVGVIGDEAVANVLINGLHRLEYRGYDSAGIALADAKKIERLRVAGRIGGLEEKLEAQEADSLVRQGTRGIGHTRWATHGAPSETNAHPHAAGPVVLAHNGIIENWQELKAQLGSAHTFSSDTDTEVIAHLLAQELANAPDEEAAILRVVAQLQGSFACAILVEGSNRIYGVCRGSPLVVARGGGKVALASDGLAVANWAQEIIYLMDREIAVLEINSVRLLDFSQLPVAPKWEKLDIKDDRVSKGGFAHFMRKEMEEQPDVLSAALAHYSAGGALRFPALPNENNISNVLMIGCGSAIHAAQTARYWLEKYASLSAHEEVASEFRDRHLIIPQDTLLVFVSQSGETADTLAAFRHCQRQGHAAVAVVNQARSSLERGADLSLPMLAGTEIGVAATKSFTSQMLVLALMSLHLAKIPLEEKNHYLTALLALPQQMRAVLKQEQIFRNLAETVLSKAGYILHLGRGAFYPIAMEGALKMKEISYIPSEGYAAGEMKHGPIAMIDERTPIIALAPDNDLFAKTLSNLQEAHARGGKIILLSDKKGLEKAGDLPQHKIEMPKVSDFTAPILYTLGVQFLSYHTACAKGLDPDRPRNLAKSVTVE